MAYGHLIDNTRVFGAVAGPALAADINAVQDELRFQLAVYGDIYEGMDAYDQLVTDAGGAPTANPCFTVSPGLARGTAIFDIAGTASTGVAVNSSTICTDGRRVYYVGGAGNIRIVSSSPADGAELWETTPTAAVVSTCTDGEYVYYDTVAAAPGGLQKRSCVDGSAGTAGGTEYGAALLATNGTYAVMANSDAGAGILTQFTAIQTIPVQHVTQPDTATTLSCICVDSDTVYVGGIRAGAVDVWAYNLSDMTAKWTAGFAAGVSSVPRAICTDGDFVYVGTDVADGINFAVLECATGSIAREIQVGVAENADGVCCDDERIYLSNNTANDVYVISKRAASFAAAGVGQVIEVLATTRDVKCCDGVSIYSYQPATGNLTRDLMGRPAKRFQIVDTDDPDRRPFHHVAIPCD